MKKQMQLSDLKTAQILTTDQTDQLKGGEDIIIEDTLIV